MILPFKFQTLIPGVYQHHQDLAVHPRLQVVPHRRLPTTRHRQTNITKDRPLMTSQCSLISPLPPPIKLNSN